LLNRIPIVQGLPDAKGLVRSAAEYRSNSVARGSRN